MDAPPEATDPLGQRSCGVLLHPSSLPSAWGIGDIGPRARAFAELLSAAGLGLWQVLPLNPTSAMADDSPYFSISSRAGNPLLISLDDLASLGLLDDSDLVPPLPESAGRVDFDLARRHKLPLLAKAVERAAANPRLIAHFAAFCAAERDWLDDHALFVALSHDRGGHWREWPRELKYRDQTALTAARERLAPAIEHERWLQFFFDEQWQALRDCCHRLGVHLFGDVPIYVSTDSADVWAHPEIFQLDDDLNPRMESGVPPDYFSATGQLWRNPVYDWAQNAATDFDWWRHRLGTLLKRFDVLRIDHFRGLVQYWSVPAGSETAIHGQWYDVPTDALFDALRRDGLPSALVAEDLGTITDDVRACRDRLNLPGMAVLHFAFDGDPHNSYLPAHHRENAVAYLGTHDNNTTRGWYEEDLDDAARGRLAEHLADSLTWNIVQRSIDLLLASRANTAMVCIQDLLHLGGEARMNTPGVATGNWRWQLTEEQFQKLPWPWLAERCFAHGRTLTRGGQGLATGSPCDR